MLEISGPGKKLSDKADTALGQINSLKSYIEGKILTLIDATIEDHIRRKALKDLIREAVWCREYFTDGIINIIEGRPVYEGLTETLPNN